MSSHEKSLNQLIDQVRSRIRARLALRGLAITLAVFAASLVIAALLAGRIHHKPGLMLLLRLLPLALAAASAMLFIFRPLRTRINDRQIARLIEEKSALSDRLSTVVECAENPGGASPAIVNRLIEDTAARCSRLRLDDVVEPRQSYLYGSASAVVLMILIGFLFFGPSPLGSGLGSLYGISEAIANTKQINVTPGTARAPRGSDQKLKAQLAGFDSDSAQVFIRRNGGDVYEAHLMEPSRNPNEFQFVIFNIQDSISYYVEAGGVRSDEYELTVADLPFVKQIDLVLNFPAYTRLAAKRIEDTGEIAALKGTVAQVTAKLSATAKAARIILNDGTKIEMTADGENQFVGSLTVKQNGTYRIELTSQDGERYNGSNEFDITVLEDHAPTVTIDKPGRDMKVTNIQEVFSQVRAEDDFGVASIELYYSVNGGEEKHVALQDLKTDTPKTLSGAHTFFLEEFGLQPGDFISYYAKARDNGADGGQASTSDIYFLEVRPFDREFRQAQQQGGQGGGEGEQDSNALTRRQREIIAATFRLQREQNNYTPQEKGENFGAVTLSQEKLKTDAEALVERIRRRLGDQLNQQPQYAKLVEYVTQAAKEMTDAVPQLRGEKPKEALPPEQRSLQQLLRAEAIFREIQVARGQQQGGQQQQQEQDMADMFELQLDKMKNQYETVQRQQSQQKNEQQDEIARRLAELARRQQQQLEQKMRQQQQGNGGGGGGSQRQQQEMIDEAQKLARELERLARDRRDPKLEEAARQLQQSADEMRRSQAAQSQASSQQGGQGEQRQMEAQAQGLRALQRMEQARRMLDSARNTGGQQSLQQLRQQAEEALRKQDEISRKVDEMARSGQGAPSAEKKEQVSESKQALADKMAGLQRDLDQTARSLGQDKQQSSDKLREAANAIRNNRIPDRIRASSQLIENGFMDQARDRERIIRGNIEEVLKNIQAAEGGASRKTQGESLEDALNRARELADNLESLRRRMESQNGGQSEQGQQAGQQQNQQGQQSGQQGQQQNSRQNGQQQGQQQGQQNGQQARAGQQGRPRQQQGQQAGQRPNQSGQQAQSGSQSQSRGSQRGRQAGRQQGQQQGQQAGQQGQEGQQAGEQSGQQSGQQGGQQAGQQGQQGQQGQRGQRGGRQGQQGQQASQQGSPSGQGNQASESAAEQQASETAGGGPPRASGDRQTASELRERLKDAEELRRALGHNQDLARDLNHITEQLRRINPEAFSDPSQMALLKNEVIEPLRQMEIELARRLQAKLGNNGAGAFSDGDAPDRYRKLIEEYYRRLSARSPEAKP